MYLSFMYMYSFLCFVIFCLFLLFLSFMPFNHVFLACSILFISVYQSYIHIIYVFLSCLHLFIHFLYFYHVPSIRLCMTIICLHHISLYSYVPIIHVLYTIISYDMFYPISSYLMTYTYHIHVFLGHIYTYCIFFIFLVSWLLHIALHILIKYDVYEITPH